MESVPARVAAFRRMGFGVIGVLRKPFGGCCLCIVAPDMLKEGDDKYGIGYLAEDFWCDRSLYVYGADEECS